MKWTLFTLILINLGLFVWHFQPNATARRSQLNDQLTQLVLVKEYEQQLQSAMDDQGVPRCYSLGPFSRKQPFIEVRDQLKKQGIDVFSRVSSEKVRKGYWVMLPAGETSNQAKVKLQQLKEQGIKEYFLVATGEMKNAISLGVFSKPNLAKRRSDEVEKLGFKVTIRPITLPNRVYWLEWPRHAPKQPDRAILDSLMQKYEGLGQTERRCMGSENK